MWNPKVINFWFLFTTKLTHGDMYAISPSTGNIGIWAEEWCYVSTDNLQVPSLQVPSLSYKSPLTLNINKSLLELPKAHSVFLFLRMYVHSLNPTIFQGPKQATPLWTVSFIMRPSSISSFPIPPQTTLELRSRTGERETACTSIAYQVRHFTCYFILF